VGGVPVRKIASPRRDLAEAGGFTAKFIRRQHSFPFRFAKNCRGVRCRGVSWGQVLHRNKNLENVSMQHLTPIRKWLNANPDTFYTPENNTESGENLRKMLICEDLLLESMPMSSRL